MYIVPELRSRKVGEGVIEKIKEIGKGRKWKRIDVTAPSEDKWRRTVDFYKKSGFVYTGSKLKTCGNWKIQSSSIDHKLNPAVALFTFFNGVGSNRL
jgi:hypothetical protein